MIRSYELQPGDRATIYFQELIIMTLENFINLSLKGLTDNTIYFKLYSFRNGEITWIRLKKRCMK